jgi:hypothetical protein
VPARPALAVKVDNLSVARPQYGLSTADIVVEEPVEGGITRFIAIYQCHGASRIEPMRSGRIVDPQILQQFGPHPLLAYAGAIGAAISAIQSSSLIDVGIYRSPVSAFRRDPSRMAPHNLVTSTAALYAEGWAENAPHAAPPSPFRFGPVLPGATPAAAVNIAYQYSDVTWTWLPKQHVYARSYGDTGPAIYAENRAPVTATNIVVLKVVMYPSQYVEDITGSHENLLVLSGAGPAIVYRNGAQITGAWRRPDLKYGTDLRDSRGRPINLAPGNTWIELVPTTIGVTATP